MVNLNPVSEQAVLQALSKVQEPELHQDLVTLNMIHDVSIEGEEVGFTVMLTTPACPLREQIEREAREAVEAVPGVKSVEVKLDANVPTDGRQRGLLKLPIRNAIGYITPEGELKIVIEDPSKKVFHRPSNICFGWENRKTAFIGSLDGTTIPYFEVPYPGMRLVHQKN